MSFCLVEDSGLDSQRILIGVEDPELDSRRVLVGDTKGRKNQGWIKMGGNF
jgi:hypothetical protein